jgi:hypothetical protein
MMYFPRCGHWALGGSVGRVSPTHVAGAGTPRSRSCSCASRRRPRSKPPRCGCPAHPTVVSGGLAALCLRAHVRAQAQEQHRPAAAGRVHAEGQRGAGRASALGVRPGRAGHQVRVAVRRVRHPHHGAPPAERAAGERAVHADGIGAELVLCPLVWSAAPGPALRTLTGDTGMQCIGPSTPLSR